MSYNRHFVPPQFSGDGEDGSSRGRSASREVPYIYEQGQISGQIAAYPQQPWEAGTSIAYENMTPFEGYPAATWQTDLSAPYSQYTDPYPSAGYYPSLPMESRPLGGDPNPNRHSAASQFIQVPGSMGGPIPAYGNHDHSMHPHGFGQQDYCHQLDAAHTRSLGPSPSRPSADHMARRMAVPVGAGSRVSRPASLGYSQPQAGHTRSRARSRVPPSAAQVSRRMAIDAAVQNLWLQPGSLGVDQSGRTSRARSMPPGPMNEMLDVGQLDIGGYTPFWDEGQDIRSSACEDGKPPMGKCDSSMVKMSGPQWCSVPRYLWLRPLPFRYHRLDSDALQSRELCWQAQPSVCEGRGERQLWTCPDEKV